MKSNRCRFTRLVSRTWLAPPLLCLSVTLALAGGWTPVTAGQEQGAPAGSTAVDLGHVQIVADLALASRFSPCGSGTPSASFTVAPSFLSLDQAQQSVDFTILQPTWLPSSTYQLQWIEVLLGDRVSLYYKDTAANPKTAAGLHGFTLDEQPWADTGGAFFVPSIPAAGTIGGQPAAFWTPTPVSCQGTTLAIPAIQEAAWEDGDLLVQLGGMGLTTDEIQQIGGSLADPS